MIKLWIPLFATFLFSVTGFSQPAVDTLGYYKLNSADSKAIYPVMKDRNSGIIFFTADFDLDADGSPRAYNEENTGLLNNLNGKKTNGKWFAVVTTDTAHLVPLKQDSTAPFPGYFISTTSLGLAGYKRTDYRRYVDPDSVSYFVLPKGKSGYEKMNIKLGDVAIIVNLKNKQQAFAIFADSGPAGVLGEGSMKLATRLHVPWRLNMAGRIRGGMDEAKILYLVLPGSGLPPYQRITDQIIEELVMGRVQALNMTLSEVITLAGVFQ